MALGSFLLHSHNDKMKRTTKQASGRRCLTSLIVVVALGAISLGQGQPVAQSPPTSGKKPNVIYFLVDNLGMGELSSYSGGPFRGVTTRRIDDFAKQGMMLLNFAPEAQCTPSRSALMTGRYSIRSGNHTVALAGSQSGLVRWERTLGDIFSAAGYATAIVGKWHIGDSPGRWPTDHGFDEWYGIPRSYDECLWPEDPWYDPKRRLSRNLVNENPEAQPQ